jgi:hypothetical protein
MISGEDMIQECSLTTAKESRDDGYWDHSGFKIKDLKFKIFTSHTAHSISRAL